MDALIISAGQDTGGQSIRWKQAADRQRSVGLRARAVIASQTYIRYPTDIIARGNGGAIRRLWTAADVIHLNNLPYAYDRHDQGRRKPAILHHHGTEFRTNSAPYLARARAERWPTAVSTLDLAEIAPDEITWLPSAYNLDELASLRAQHRREPDGIVRIAHAPTNRDLKSTAVIEATVAAMQADGLPVELDVIEMTTWAECLRRKAAADIFVDQLLLGYGCNAVESWGMGIPVIAGIDLEGAAAAGHAIPASTRDRMLREFGALPFYEATEATLADTLREFVKSPKLRAKWAVKGMEHVARFHAELPALERLMNLYRRAIARDIAPSVAEAVT